MNCNHCANSRCKGKAKESDCPGHIDPSGKFPLIELTLAHPQALADAFSGLLKDGIKMEIRDYI